MEDLYYNVTDFHNYVEEQITSLEGYGKMSEDLTTYLFSAYESVPYEYLHGILIRKQADYHMEIQDLKRKELIDYEHMAHDTRSINKDKPWPTKCKELH